MPTPSFLTFLAPLMLLVPVAGAAGASAGNPPAGTAQWAGQGVISRAWRQEPAFQVRIERQTSIRITPRAAPMPMPMPPSMFVQMPRAPMEPRYLERKIGKCLPMSGIAGVQAVGGSRLMLFMRDQRIVSAALERACRARDFYSGFYLSPSEDGQLCVDRDALQSRNGANCRLTRIRQLVFLDD